MVVDHCTNWRGRAEQSTIEEKHYIIRYSPKTPLGSKVFETPAIKRFKYREDYKKLKKVDKIIRLLLDELDNERGLKCLRILDYLENFVEKCNFTKIDYDDGRLFRTKFYLTNIFLAEGGEDFSLMREIEEDAKDVSLNKFL